MLQDNTFGSSLNSNDAESNYLVLVWIQMMPDKTYYFGLNLVTQNQTT